MAHDTDKKIGVNYDWNVLLLYGVLVFFGWLNIYAVGYEKQQGLFSLFAFSTNAGKQFIWILGCIFLLFFSLFFNTQFYRSFAYLFYAISLLILAATLLWGIKVGGHSAWFRWSKFQLQPTEFVKWTSSLALAKYLEDVNVKLTHLKNQLIVCLLALAPATIILLQGDLGSALVFSSFVIVFYREGFPVLFLVVGLALLTLFILTLLITTNYLIIGILSLGLLLAGIYRKSVKKIFFIACLALSSITFISATEFFIHHILKPHQQNRLTTLIDPSKDPLGIGWNVTQSKIAIGSGGCWGKGFLHGTQTKYGFVPEQDKDFIFCTIGEEYGWVGSSIFIILFMYLTLRLLQIAERQRLRFARVYGYAVTSILFFHFFVNVGMTLGLLPVIGIPLPFISYGGSSLWAFSMMLFILLKFDAERNQYLSWKSSVTD